MRWGAAALIAPIGPLVRRHLPAIIAPPLLLGRFSYRVARG